VSVQSQQLRVQGHSVTQPPRAQVTDFEGDAKFVLLVEKDAAFMRLAEDRFYNDYPCIILTAKGQPDVATRLFLRKLRLQLKLPVLALVDSDPYGLKILSARSTARPRAACQQCACTPVGCLNALLVQVSVEFEDAPVAVHKCGNWARLRLQAST
jgi:DNA topoisomerase VI subunit A